MSAGIPNCIDEVRQVFKNYSSHDDRTQHVNADKASPQIGEIIRSIATQVTQQVPFTVKQQALNAVIEIAAHVLTEGDRSVIGKDVREHLPSMPIGSAISHILDMLSPEELAALQADGEIPKAILDLRSRARSYALDLDIDEAVDRLWLAESDQEDDIEMTS